MTTKVIYEVTQNTKGRDNPGGNTCAYLVPGDKVEVMLCDADIAKLPEYVPVRYMEALLCFVRLADLKFYEKIIVSPNKPE